MASGVIKKLVTDKGFGFIRPEKAGPDIFFHCSALEDKSQFDALKEGQKVSYDETTGQGGKPRAENVVVR